MTKKSIEIFLIYFYLAVQGFLYYNRTNTCAQTAEKLVLAASAMLLCYLVARIFYYVFLILLMFIKTSKEYGFRTTLNLLKGSI